MPLTPEDVSNKRFTTVRLKEGYDMIEVDQFLDEVEAELGRLLRENDELRSKLAAAQSGEQSGAQSAEHSGDHAGAAAPVGLDKPSAADEARPAGEEPAPVDQEPVSAAEEPAAPADEPVETTSQPVAVQADQPVDQVAARQEAVTEPAPRTASYETLRVSTTAEASAAATKLLELATRNAEELVADAQQQAQQILGAAQVEADRLGAEARQRSESLDSQTAERRQHLFTDLERERDELAGEVERLRSFEREYRAELKGYFQKQLEALDGPMAAVDQGGSLAVLTHDEDHQDHHEG